MRNKEYDKIKKYINEGADIFAPWYNELNALEYVCAVNDTEALKIFLSSNYLHKIQKNPDAASIPPILIAAAMGNEEIISELLQKNVFQFHPGRHISSIKQKLAIDVRYPHSWLTLFCEIIFKSPEVQKKGKQKDEYKSAIDELKQAFSGVKIDEQ